MALGCSSEEHGVLALPSVTVGGCGAALVSAEQRLGRVVLHDSVASSCVTCSPAWLPSATRIGVWTSSSSRTRGEDKWATHRSKCVPCHIRPRSIRTVNILEWKGLNCIDQQSIQPSNVNHSGCCASPIREIALLGWLYSTTVRQAVTLGNVSLHN